VKTTTRASPRLSFDFLLSLRRLLMAMSASVSLLSIPVVRFLGSLEIVVAERDEEEAESAGD